MRLRIGLATAALVFLFAGSALADTEWRTGETCGAGTATSKLHADGSVSWCPGAVTTASKKMKFSAGAICQLAATSGKSLVVKGAFNAVSRWISPGATSCDYTATPAGPCSFFSVEAGEVLTMEMDVADANAAVVCSAGEAQ